MRVYFLTSNSTWTPTPRPECDVFLSESAGATSGGVNAVRVPFVVREHLTDRDLPVSVRLHPHAAEAGLILTGYDRRPDHLVLHVTSVTKISSLPKGSPIAIASLLGDTPVGRAMATPVEEPVKKKRGKK